MAAPASITKAAVTSVRVAFSENSDRARELYRKIVVHGYSGSSKVTAAKLNSPDSRDAAQFIYFEIAAKFEDFAKTMFQMEVRAKLGVTAARSSYVMGDPDSGADNKLGWGSPVRLKERGHNLLGPDSFFGSLPVKLGLPTYNLLVTAHTVRNRIAHTGGRAQQKFVKLLEAEGIPKSERKGLGIGRYLRDYPSGSTPTDRHFFRFLAAYDAFAAKAEAAIP